MKIKLAWLSIIGGFLWSVKPIYDALYNGRTMNTAYTPSDPTDYLSFIFPLFCLGGLMVVYSAHQGKIRNSVRILIAAVILSGCFHFSEIYFYGSDVPFGFIFLFTSTICMIIGSIYLFLQLKKVDGTRRLLPWTALALFLDNFLLIVTAFLTGVLPAEITNPIAAILLISVGFIWAAFGLAALRLVKLDMIGMYKYGKGMRS